MSPERAAYRRANWVGGVAHSFAEAEEQDLEFWMNATPEQRIRGVADLTREFLSEEDQGELSPRLQRTVGGVCSRNSLES